MFWRLPSIRHTSYAAAASCEGVLAYGVGVFCRYCERRAYAILSSKLMSIFGTIMAAGMCHLGICCEGRRRLAADVDRWWCHPMGVAASKLPSCPTSFCAFFTIPLCMLWLFRRIQCVTNWVGH